MAKSISNANSEKDLNWWKRNNGPDMPMKWPQFEVYVTKNTFRN